MIEEKLDTLINSMNRLTEVIDRLWEDRDKIKDGESLTETKPAKETKPSKDVKSAPTDKTIKNIPENLYDLCLSIVRKTPSAKDEIQTILSNRLVKDIPPKELPGIQIQLQALYGQ